jgi:hypothetical protein
MANKVQLVCKNVTPRHPSGNLAKLQYEFTARLYFENGTYFQGRGKTDAEAIGDLVCKCKEQFNIAEFDIVAEFAE